MEVKEDVVGVNKGVVEVKDNVIEVKEDVAPHYLCFSLFQSSAPIFFPLTRHAYKHLSHWG